MGARAPTGLGTLEVLPIHDDIVSVSNPRKRRADMSQVLEGTGVVDPYVDH